MTARAKSYKRGKTFAPEVRLTPGPRAMGDTGDGSYQTLYGYAWAAVLDRAERRFRLFQAQVPGEGPWPLNDPRGPEVAVWVEVEVPPLPHPVEEIAHMGVAFDQAARHVVVYERQGEVWIRQWDPVTQQFVMRGPFPGHDPVVLNDAVVGFFPPDSDVLVWHLSPDRKTLVQRVQRQLYATAQVVQTFQEPVTLDQTVALPYQIQLLGSLQSALDATGYALRSELYPVRAYGEASVSSAALDCNLKPVLVPYESADNVSITGSLPEARYLESAYQGTANEVVVASGAATAALYRPATIPATAADAAQSLAAPTGAVYKLVVFRVDRYEEVMVGAQPATCTYST